MPRILSNEPLGPGDSGTIQTLGKMADLAREGAPRVREALAREYGPRVGGLSPVELRAWIARRVTFTPDPEGVELVRAPWETLRAGVGDCDCIATLAASGALALGWEARFVTVGRAAWEHVFTEARAAMEWTDYDLARDGTGHPPGGGLPRLQRWPPFHLPPPRWSP